MAAQAIGVVSDKASKRTLASALVRSLGTGHRGTGAHGHAGGAHGARDQARTNNLATGTCGRAGGGCRICPDDAALARKVDQMPEPRALIRPSESDRQITLYHAMVLKITR
jgi:hypothetical protein